MQRLATWRPLRHPPRARGLKTVLRQRRPGAGWHLLHAEHQHQPTTHHASRYLLDGRAKAARATGDDDTDATDKAPREQRSLAERALATARQVLLPAGYPHTVQPTYLSYVQWTALGLVSGRVQAVLATQAALFTVGLGSGAIPMAAAIQWVLKDGIGHAAAIGYATAVNTRFDADAKRYRFQSTLALTFADFVAVFMPLAPQHFLLLGSISSGTSSIAGVAQAAARARVMASFARRGNLADCTRCGQTQSKLMSIIGTGAGIALSWVIGPQPYTVIATMVPLAGISIYAMHVSTSLVVLRTLNQQRAELLFRRTLERMHEERGDAFLSGAPPSVSVPLPQEVAVLESFGTTPGPIFARPLALQPLLGAARRSGGFWSEWLGVSTRIDRGAIDLLPSCLARAACDDGGGEVKPSDDDGWSVWWGPSRHFAIAHQPAAQGGTVMLWHAKETAPTVRLQAMWCACALRFASERGLPKASVSDEALITSWEPVITALMRAQWDVKNVFLDGDGGFLELDADR